MIVIFKDIPISPKPSLIASRLVHSDVQMNRCRVTGGNASSSFQPKVINPPQDRPSASLRPLKVLAFLHILASVRDLEKPFVMLSDKGLLCSPHNPKGPSVSPTLASPQDRAAGRRGSGWGASSSCGHRVQLLSTQPLLVFHSLAVETIAFLSSTNVLIIPLMFTDPLSC